MAKLVANPVVEVTTTFTVTEAELLALDGLAAYGDDAFIEMFYKGLGTTYMKPHEEGLRIFLQSIRQMAGPIINKTGKARAVFKS